MKRIMFAAVLTAILLAGCQNQGKVNTGTQAKITEVTRVEHAAGQIVYIHLDSLLMEYGLAKDLQKSFQTKYEKAEKEIGVKREKFERDYLDFENKAQKGLATRLQLAEMQETLQRQDLQLRQDLEKITGELAEEEQVINNRIFFAITDFLKEYNADNRYGMIISTNTTGPILNADPALSITKDVLKELNARYEKEKAAGSK